MKRTKARGGVAGDIISWIMIAKHMAQKSPKKLDADTKRYFKVLDETVAQRSETAMDFAQKLRILGMFGESSMWKGFQRFSESLFFDFVQLVESDRKLSPPRPIAAE